MPKAFFSYIRSPNLVCAQRTDSALTLYHFGQPFIYNSDDPGLALTLLRLTTKKQRFSDLVSKTRLPASQIQRELDRLVEYRVLIAEKSGISKTNTVISRYLSYLDQNNEARQAIANRISRLKIGIYDFAGLSRPLLKNLNKIGFYSCEVIQENDVSAPNLDFYVVCGDLSRSVQISKLNRSLKTQNRRWLLFSPDRFGGTVGPVFGAGGPCYDCLVSHRQRQLGGFDDAKKPFDLLDGEAQFSYENHPFAATLTDFAITETIKFLSGVARAKTVDGFFSFDFFNFEMDYAPVFPYPNCPTCLTTR